jgi:Polyphosphate kinase
MNCLHGRFGRAVRLEIEDDCPQSIIDYLLDEFDLSEQELYRIDGPINLSRLSTVLIDLN